jgi:hypothetical protein
VSKSAKVVLVARRLRSRKKGQRQNGLSGFILYGHHQGRVVVRALFSQLHDFALGVRKRRRDIRQVCTLSVMLNPIRSAYREEISRHASASKVFCVCCDDKSIPILFATLPAQLGDVRVDPPRLVINRRCISSFPPQFRLQRWTELNNSFAGGARLRHHHRGRTVHRMATPRLLRKHR